LQPTPLTIYDGFEQKQTQKNFKTTKTAKKEGHKDDPTMTCNDHEHYEVLPLRPDQLLNFRSLLSDGLDHLFIDRIPISRLMPFGAT
jgi:hypothetical protein